MRGNGPKPPQSGEAHHTPQNKGKDTQTQTRREPAAEDTVKTQMRREPAAEDTVNSGHDSFTDWKAPRGRGNFPSNQPISQNPKLPASFLIDMQSDSKLYVKSQRDRSNQENSGKEEVWGLSLPGLKTHSEATLTQTTWGPLAKVQRTAPRSRTGSRTFSQMHSLGF